MSSLASTVSAVAEGAGGYSGRMEFEDHAPSTSTAIATRDLSISYGSRVGDAADRVLSGATFSVAEGGILGIVGTAGSGKTALGRILSGRQGRDWPQISGGDAVVSGIDLRRPTRADRRRISLDVGYLAQNSGDLLRNDLTVAENIAEPVLARDRSFDRRILGRAAAMLIDAVDLELGVLNRFPFELSRGQRQRVAFAQALIVEPSVVIVDEPAQGVDILARPALFALLERLNQARACTLLVISHDLATVERLTDRVMVLDRGVVLAIGNIDEVLDSPIDPYLRRMRQAREFARAPLPGLVDRETIDAVERVADGLFIDEDPVAEAELAAESDQRRLVEQRPEFERFQDHRDTDPAGTP